MRDSASQLLRVPLGQLADVDPDVLPESTRPHFAFKYVDISSVTTGRIDLPSQTTAFAEAPSRARMKLRSGDVLMSTVRPNLKAFAQCRFDDDNLVASTGFAVIRAKENADSYFLLCSILSSDVSAQIERVAVGSNYPAINVRDVQRLLLPKFSLEEQRGIGAALRSLDNAIEAIEALIEKHQQIKVGLMRDLFTRGLLPSGELRPSPMRAPDLYWQTQLGVVPRDWQPVPLAALVSSDITYGIVQAGPHIDDATGVPYVRTGDMSGHFLDRSQMLCTSPAIATAYKRSEIREGDIVMAIRATVGKVLRVPPELNGANLTQGTAKIAPKDDVDGSFLLWAMRQDRFKEQVLSAIKGTTFAEITLAALRQLPLAMPTSREEKSLIASRLDLHQEVTRAEQRQLAKLRFQKRGLMQDLLTGKIRVPLPEPEVTA